MIIENNYFYEKTNIKLIFIIEEMMLILMDKIGTQGQFDAERSKCFNCILY